MVDDERYAWTEPRLGLGGIVDLTNSGLFEVEFPEIYLITLNGKRAFGSECRKAVTGGNPHKLSDFAAQFRRPAAAPATDAAYAESDGVLRDQLRRLVDEWIGSGFGPGGVEFPQSRELPFTGPAHLAGTEWLMDNSPSVGFSQSGEINVIFLSGGVEARGWKVREGSIHTMEIRPVDDPVSEARQEAAWLFLGLLSSPLLYAIAQCSRCRRYYFRKKLRKQYRRETFCPDCRSSASAMRRTEQLRKQKRAAMLLAAAKAVIEWSCLSESTRLRHGDETSYIVHKIKKFGVTRKWVTRNIMKIEEYTGHLGSNGQH